MGKKKPNGYFSNMSNEELMSYIERNHKGKSVAEFCKEDSRAGNITRRRKILDALVDEGILLRRNRKKGFLDKVKDFELIKYVESHFSGWSIVEFQKNDGRVYQEVNARNLIDILADNKILVRSIVKHDSWKSLDYTIEQAKSIIKKLHVKSLPSSDILRENGFSQLCNAIQRHHGGFYEFRKKLYEVQNNVKKGEWKNLPFTLEYARKWLQKNPEYLFLPSFDELYELDESSLASSISKYHGGFHRFRKLLGEKPKMREKGLLKNLEYVINEALVLMNKHGWNKLPAEHILYKKGYKSFSRAVSKYHGGFPAFREKLREYLGQTSQKSELEGLIKDYISGGEN